ncbi:hypothetical protein NBRC116583_02040 [Arenicella sp. 4NH20-0111]|uniref:tetratricopeptide repeat protein n=1 Tax=Arenicella sp. 4NH20-0111 TaxID=3127648 RepID=UPI00310B080F
MFETNIDQEIRNFHLEIYDGFDVILEFAKSGHIDACGCLGLAYQFGLNCEIDADKSEYYLKFAAERGHAQSAHNLGTFYITHNIDLEASKFWFREARSLGFQPG